MNADRFSDAFVLEQAKQCETLAQLQGRVQWPDFQSLRATAKRLGIDLPVIRSSRAGAPRAAQAVPKPAGKGKAPAKKEGGE